MKSPEMHPLNAILRFSLEIAALGSFGYWGWHHFTGVPQWIIAIGLPLLIATVWGIFRVPGDASASGEAVVPVSGLTRLSLELAMFVFAAMCLFASDQFDFGGIFSGLVLFHYLSSIKRIKWMLRN